MTGETLGPHSDQDAMTKQVQAAEAATRSVDNYHPDVWGSGPVVDIMKNSDRIKEPSIEVTGNSPLDAQRIDASMGEENGVEHHAYVTTGYDGKQIGVIHTKKYDKETGRVTREHTEDLGAARDMITHIGRRVVARANEIAERKKAA